MASAVTCGDSSSGCHGDAAERCVFCVCAGVSDQRGVRRDVYRVHPFLTRIDGAGWGWHTRCRRLIKREMIRRATELFTLKLDTAPKAAAMETDEMKVRGRWVCVWRGRDDA